MSTADHAKDMAIGFISGLNGGIATVYVGQPLDTIKVKMQTFPNLYTNGFKCFLDTFRKDGIYRGLYSGTVPALAANIAENSVLFCAYAPSQKFVATVMEKRPEDLKPIENAVAGSMAAFWCSFVLCPTELVKCRMQALRETAETGNSAVNPKSVGPWKITRQIFRESGFPGFFRGLVPTMGREVPGYFFFFGGYEISRRIITPEGAQREDLGVVGTAFCGGVGGTCLWTVIFPMDVVKSRIQVASAYPNTVKLGTLTILVNIVKQEGFRTLYKGLGPTLVRTFPATGALFVAYEYTKDSLKKMFPYS